MRNPALRTANDGSGDGTIYVARVIQPVPSFEAVGYLVIPMASSDPDSDYGLEIKDPTLPSGRMVLLLRAGGLDDREELNPNYTYGFSEPFLFSNETPPISPTASAGPAPSSVAPSSAQGTSTDRNAHSSSAVPGQPSHASPGTASISLSISTPATSFSALPSPSPSSPSATVIGAAVGGVLGALVLGLAAALLFVLSCRRKRNKQPDVADEQRQAEQEREQPRICEELDTHMDNVGDLHGEEKTQGPRLQVLADAYKVSYELPAGVDDGRVLR